jgi:hypothetical protein
MKYFIIMVLFISCNIFELVGINSKNDLGVQLSHGLFGFWNFNDSSALQSSYSDNELIASYATAPTSISDSVHGLALDFSSAIAQASTPIYTSSRVFVTADGEFSISFWFKGSTPVTVDNVLVSFDGTGAIGFTAGSSASFSSLVIGTGNFPSITFSDLLSTANFNSSWQHVVLIVKPANGNFSVAVYVNGQHSDEQPSTTGLFLSETILLGSDEDGGGIFENKIDSIAVWSRALDESNIQELYTLRSGLD